MSQVTLDGWASAFGAFSIELSVDVPVQPARKMTQAMATKFFMESKVRLMG
jgi:hypothetical protein